MPQTEKIKYPYLPKEGTILYVPADDPFMGVAERIRSEESTDQRQPTGAVIVRDGEIIGRGANQSRFKSAALIKLHQRFCVRKLLGVPSGKKYWLCPGCATHSEHAESRAVRDAKRNLKDATGAELYLYGHWWCCKECWDAMLGAGIRQVYLLEGSEIAFRYAVK